MFSKIRAYIVRYKIRSVIALIVIGVAGWYGYQYAFGTSDTATRYVLGTVTRGTIESSVTGSGQVSASNQVDLKSKASGKITRVMVVAGQKVKAGQLIAQIDSSDAQVSLRNAQISLEKTLQPAETSSLLDAQNAVKNAQTSKQKAEDDLTKQYDDVFSVIATTMKDIPDALEGLNDTINTNSGYLNYGRTARLDNRARELKSAADKSRNNAVEAFNATFAAYEATSRTGSRTSIDKLIQDAYQTSQEVAQAVKDTQTAVEYIRNYSGTPDAVADSTRADLSVWLTTANSHIAALKDAENSIINLKNTIESSNDSITQKNESLRQLQSGADPLDVESKQLAVRQEEQALEDYNIRAPISGTVAALDVKVGNDVSNSTAIGTLIADGLVADISLNEIDVAKVKTGQKAKLTFDAIDGLELEGTVSEVGMLGEVSQGVVTYSVQIAFVDDSSIKPGMSVSATIVTETKDGVLSVPSSAIKTQNGHQYVEVPDTSTISMGDASSGTTSGTGNFGSSTRSSRTVESTATPHRMVVETGIANDTMTEITSGLNEGDQIIVRTITTTTTTSQTQTPSLFQAVGGNRNGTNNRTSTGVRTGAGAGGFMAPR